MRAKSKAEKELELERRKEKEARSYDTLFGGSGAGAKGQEVTKKKLIDEAASADATVAKKFEEDFM
jgi:hypothetical protein